jgi:hypothetical protein
MYHEVGDDRVAHSNLPGSNMSSKISDEDGRAVDLILDQQSTGRRVPDASARFAEPALHGRIQAAQQLLSLLDDLPTAEPPLDLMSKTWRRICAAEATPHEHRSSVAATLAQNRPSA